MGYANNSKRKHFINLNEPLEDSFSFTLSLCHSVARGVDAMITKHYIVGVVAGCEECRVNLVVQDDFNKLID